VSLLADIARYSLLAFAAVLFVLQLAAREVGYAFGHGVATELTTWVEAALAPSVIRKALIAIQGDGAGLGSVPEGGL
jgi:hypothetical protein